jgi:sucrose-6-phosphate hydrolase SacC (GH32 family)
MKRFLPAAAALAGFLAASVTLYHELWRLQYHFSPARTWTNDPNGLVWYKGEFHLFYQNNPFGDKWGHMSWGHAVSKDLLHWKELPVAIPEENGIMIFSGSAVVDANDASGLCQSTEPNDPSCLIAIYTGHTATLQTQNIAVSNDRGRTFTKYKGNPVLDLHMKDFRDPKVTWYAPAKKWVMAVSLPNEHKIRFYGSKNLLQWALLSEFGPAGATGGQWECPDLFEMSAAEKTDARKWVLIVNVNPGGVQGGSAVQYFVGKFDGTAFHNDNPAEQTLWADWGKDYYAAVTYYDSPPGDMSKYLIGWFSNWEYANDEPTAPQRGAMAIPRELMLARRPGSG